MKLKIEYWPIRQFQRYERNVMEHTPEEAEELGGAMERFGFLNPILATPEGMIISGHGRLLSAEMLGLEEVPVICVSHLSDGERRAFAIADNKLGRRASFDMGNLIAELEELSAASLSLDDLGFDAYELDALLGEGVLPELPGFGDGEPAGDGRPIPPQENGTLEEYEPEAYSATVESEIYVLPGDVWEIGRHLIACIDCTDEKSLSVLGSGFDLGLNDPPYGMGKEAEGVENDNLNKRKLLAFNNSWIPLQLSMLSENGSFYVFGQDVPLMDIYSEILRPEIDRGALSFRNMITWDKGSGQGQNHEGWRMYAVADEKCLFAMKGPQHFCTNSDSYWEGWEPIRQKVYEAVKSLGLSDNELAEEMGYKSGRTVNHWHDKSQWGFVNFDNWEKLCEVSKRIGKGNLPFEYDAIKAEYDAIKAEYDAIKAEFHKSRAYFDNTHANFNNVLHFQRAPPSEREAGHATPKPLALCRHIIKTSCPEGGRLVDFFGGSGSSMVAAEQTGRFCTMAEISPMWVQATIERMASMFGIVAKKINPSSNE